MKSQDEIEIKITHDGWQLLYLPLDRVYLSLSSLAENDNWSPSEQICAYCTDPQYRTDSLISYSTW